MGFIKIPKLTVEHKVIKQHYLVKNSNDKKYWVFDAGIKTPYYFNCPTCKKSNISIAQYGGQDGRKAFDMLGHEALIKNGGSGTNFDIFECTKCQSVFYIGFGYFELQKGRDIFLIQNILEIVKV